MIEHTAEYQLETLLQRLEGAYAYNTLRAYRADMQEFITYCTHYDRKALPAEASTVSDFLMDVSGRALKISTIRRKIASISSVHKFSSVADPTKHPNVQITLRKISRQLGNRCKQAYPVTRPILEKLLAVCSNDLHGVRDRALLHLAYGSMRRRSEIVALRIEDMDCSNEEGISILIRKGKTDPFGTGKWIHLSKPCSQAVVDWLQAAKITSGFIMRGIKRNYELTGSLCTCRISRIYKTLAKRAQLSDHVVQGISGHSMRVGGAQDLLIHGASLPQIMLKGGWSKTDTVMRYVERVRTPLVDTASRLPWPI